MVECNEKKKILLQEYSVNFKMAAKIQYGRQKYQKVHYRPEMNIDLIFSIVNADMIHYI